MRAVDIIVKKRGNPLFPHGEELTRSEIEFLINGYVKGEIPDYQISPLLMAIYFNGMSFSETGVLTDVMLNSGSTIDLSGLYGPFVDKHSTGGVGDKISIPLAPIAAACGLKVPMMSGRALGHTGGTLDKLESITGYRTDLSVSDFRRIIEKTGFAMTGQTKEIVPADRLLYALRDVTGTVESIPLITASILSKKVAEGAEALVFDVKYGSGAFMKSQEDAERLAQSLAGTGHAMGKKIVALITDMNEPLGNTVGNFLEIEESMDVLAGKGPSDVTELTYTFAGWMAVLGGITETVDEGKILAEKAVASGRAMELFMENVQLQGGDTEKLLADKNTRRSSYHHVLTSSQDGFIAGIDAYKLGLAGVHLGVGRNRTDESVDPDAGIIIHFHKGDSIKKGDIIFDIFGKNEESLEPAAVLIEQALTCSDRQPEKTPLIIKEITAL
ncbi:thymidine phosphorylase [Brucepastera parasyntrophica]|uniref:thymidine phosphorylase n=1 Tax=Brucepastera parasyntrophica TaxID=2880008 RepID=UPI00210D7B55|nr:thymidine phosphorylase [Brucepastera parasyntrophica]ULQ60642.1 thymidine phosphorylase [Brucepastera parasyntrophica]